MVGRTDDDRVDVAVQLVEHPAVVMVLGGVRELVEGAGGAGLAWALASEVHVAQGDDARAAHAAAGEFLPRPAGDDGQVVPASATGADDGDVHAPLAPTARAYERAEVPANRPSRGQDQPASDKVSPTHRWPAPEHRHAGGPGLICVVQVVRRISRDFPEER